MKTDERIGLTSFSLVGLFILPLFFRRPPPPSPAQIPVLPGELVMAIPEDDSPCAEQNVLLWGAVPLKKFAAQIGADTLPLAALPENLRSVILEQNPRSLYLFGHGYNYLYTCEKCQWFLTSAGLNLDLVPGRYWHLLSCLTAKDLGYKIIEAGATAFFGYFEDFYLIVHRAGPGSGRFVEAVLYGDMQIEVLLLAGEEDLKVIYDGAIQRFNEEIAYWEEHWAKESCNGYPIRESEAQMLINTLIHNRDVLRCYFPAGQYPEEEALEILGSGVAH